MNITDKLLAEASDVWQAYNEHPFVLGIQNGTLDKDKFRYYIIQDYLYLQDYAKVFALGVAKATTVKRANRFAKFLSVMNGEMDVHKGYLAKLGITQAEIDATPRALDNLSYTSYMLRVAYEESETEILVATLSCAYSYEYIAKNMVKNNPDSINHEFYGDWVKGYISQSYCDENALLFEEVNALAKNYSAKQIKHLVDIFVACSRYELAFWQMSWIKAE